MNLQQYMGLLSLGGAFSDGTPQYAVQLPNPKNVKNPVVSTGFGKSLIQIVLVLKFFNSSASVCEFLLTCKEWMARWANICFDFFLYRLCHKCVTACASYFTFLVVRMDSFLHANHLFPAQVKRLRIITARFTASTLYHMSTANTSVFSHIQIFTRKSRVCRYWGSFILSSMPESFASTTP